MSKLTAILLVALLGFVVADFEFPRTHDVNPAPATDRYSDAVGEYYCTIDQNTLIRIDCTNPYEFCSEATMEIPNTLGEVYGILGFDNEDLNDYAIIFGENMIALYEVTNNEIVDEQAIDVDLKGSELYIAGNKIVFVKYGTYAVYDGLADAGSRFFTLPGVPSAHLDSAVAVLPDKLFVAGGKLDTDGPLPEFSADVFYITLSPAGVWEQTVLSQARSKIGAVGYDGKVFFAGGLCIDSTFDAVSSVVDIWDEVSQSWDAVELQSYPRSDIIAVANDGKVLFVGGDRMPASDPTYKQGSDSLDVFDIATKEFTGLSMSSPRVKYSVAFTGSSIAIAGGLNPETNAVLASVDVFETKSGALSSVEMSQARLFNNYIHGGAIGIHDESIFVYGGRLGPEASSGISNRLDMFDRSLLAITALSTGLSTVRETMYSMAEAIEGQIGYLDVEIKGHTERLDSLNASVSFIDALENQIVALDAKVEERVQVVTVSIDELKNTNAELKKQVNELTATVKKLQDNIKKECLADSLKSGACIESSSKSNTTTIIAASVGSAVGVLLIVAVAYFFMKKKKTERDEPLLNINTINA